MSPVNREPNAAQLSIVNDAFADYAQRRIESYQQMSLGKLLSKDVLMYALRGVRSTDGFVESAFSAFESSSEETMMGHVWQGIVKALAIPSAIEGGDLLVEREDTLWIVEIKSARNTFNSDSRAQAIRKLKERVGFLSSVHRVRPIPVKAMIGMLNGPSRDKIETFKASRFSNENRDIDGFQYRQMVGAAFWRWIVGSENILPYLGDFESIGATIAECRLDAVSRLKTEMRQQLHDLGFPEDISGVLLLKYSALDRS